MRYVTIDLGRGYKAIIDEESIPILGSKRWRAQICDGGKTIYARSDEGGNYLLMHRLIMNAPKGVVVDHINKNGLDNRMSNLRLATYVQNAANRGPDKRNLLGIKGVSKRREKYKARIFDNGKQIFLGSFDTKEEASAAYQGAAKVLWGKYASHK